MPAGVGLGEEGRSGLGRGGVARPDPGDAVDDVQALGGGEQMTGEGERLAPPHLGEPEGSPAPFLQFLYGLADPSGGLVLEVEGVDAVRAQVQAVDPAHGSPS
ncbi:hypothetical protein SGLAM104S_01735 [Streptomyces glaucescens]